MDSVTASQLDPVLEQVEADRKMSTLTQRLGTVETRIHALIPTVEQWESIGRVERSARLFRTKLKVRMRLKCSERENPAFRLPTFNLVLNPEFSLPANDTSARHDALWSRWPLLLSIVGRLVHDADAMFGRRRDPSALPHSLSSPVAIACVS